MTYSILVSTSTNQVIASEESPETTVKSFVDRNDVRGRILNLYINGKKIMYIDCQISSTFQEVLAYHKEIDIGAINNNFKYPVLCSFHKNPYS